MQDEEKDPMSGYASGDAIQANDGPGETHQSIQDPASGYTSADVLDHSSEINQPVDTDEEAQDPMSGYASGDALEGGEGDTG